MRLRKVSARLWVGDACVRNCLANKKSEDSAEIVERIGQQTCRSSRVRGWDSSRILVRNCRKNRVFAKRGELSKVPGGGRRPWFLGDPPTVLLRAYPPDAQVRPRWSFPSGQKLKDACRVIIRFAVCELNGPPTKAFDSPNCGDVRIPIGVARFTLLKAFLTFTAKVRAYLLFVAPASIPRPPGPPPGPPRPGPPGPRPNVPPPIPPPWPAFAAFSSTGPNPKVLLKRKFNENRPGPSP